MFGQVTIRLIYFFVMFSELPFTNENITMDLIQLVLILIAVGVGLWLINRFIPMDAKIKSILNIVVVIVVIIWLLKVFGVLDMNTIHVGK